MRRQTREVTVRRTAKDRYGISGFGIVRSMFMHTKGMQRRFDRLTAMIRAEWAILASTHLNTTKREYIANSVVTRKGSKIRMELTGLVPVAVEEGQPPIDLMAALLRGKSARRSKTSGEMYAIVPFVHKTAELRQVPGLYAAAKRLTTTQFKPGSRLGDDLGRRFSGLQRRLVSAKRSSYVTFRGVSRQGKAQWRTSGVRARKLMRKLVNERLPRMLGQVF